MGKAGTSEEKRPQHNRKFTQDLLNNELILQALNIRPGQTLLDAGCGNGYMSKLFSKVVTVSGKVYALDADEYFLQNLQNETRGTNIETIKGDITRPTQIREASLDLIYLSAVMHVFSQKDLQGFSREAQRLLKPDALLAIVEIEKKETPFGPPMELRYSPDELKNLIPLPPENTVRVGEHFYMQIFRNKVKPGSAVRTLCRE